MKESRKSASGIKQNEEGKIYARYMGNLHEMSCAHVCVCVCVLGLGGRVKF